MVTQFERGSRMPTSDSRGSSHPTDNWMSDDASQNIGEPGLRIDAVILAVTIRLYMAGARRPLR